MNYVFILAIGIGIVAGLRSLTAPALVAWAAYLGWLNLQASPFAFMGSTTAVAIFSVLALGELVADKLPKAPQRRLLVYWRASPREVSAGRLFAQQSENRYSLGRS